jgi:dTDP-4-dehydrorhamnose 3,5-epimerase
MQAEPLEIAGAFRIRLAPATDARGSFARTFCSETFARLGLRTDFPQRSISVNIRRGTLRGLHGQADPHAETKLVRCSRGALLDVIVDARRASPTFGRWHGEPLSALSMTMLYIPPGCLHGFQTLADDTQVEYEITPAYVPGASLGVRFDDPDLAIAWPLAEPIVSDRDLALPTLRELMSGARSR